MRPCFRALGTSCRVQQRSVFRGGKRLLCGRRNRPEKQPYHHQPRGKEQVGREHSHSRAYARYLQRHGRLSDCCRGLGDHDRRRKGENSQAVRGGRAGWRGAGQRRDQRAFCRTDALEQEYPRTPCAEEADAQREDTRLFQKGSHGLSERRKAHRGGGSALSTVQKVVR